MKRFLRKYIFKTYRLKMKQSEAGQGIIEYILMLVITVTLIMALSRGVGKPIANYLENQVFDMVGCMLRVGEMPHIAFELCGGTEALDFDFEGAYADAAESTSGGSGSTSNSGSDSAAAEEDGGGDGGQNGGNESNSPRIRERPRNGSVDGGGRNRSNAGRNTDGFDFNDNGADNKIKIDGENNSSPGSFKANLPKENGSTVMVRKIRRNNQRVGGGFTLISGEPEEDTAQAAAPTIRTQKAPESAIERERRRVSSFSMPKPQNNDGANVNLDEAPSFSFIGLIKWGLIIAILILFALFTLSQLNNIRKGWTD